MAVGERVVPLLVSSSSSLLQIDYVQGTLRPMTRYVSLRAGWVTISSIEGLNECCSMMLFGKLVGLQLNGMIGMYVLQ